MRRTTAVITIALLVAIAAIGVATAGSQRPKPTIVRAGKMVLELNGDITPKALPRHDFAPMGFWGSGKLSTVDGSHPPALESSVFEADKDIAVSVKGLPVCRIDQLRAIETERAEAVCGDAIIGRGRATVEVGFPDQEPFDSTGPLLFLNGGERNGVVTVFLHAYVSVPAPTAVVATARVRRVNKGSLGLRVSVDVPRIAGGSGSVVSAIFSVRRYYAYKGKRRSVISGRCPDGRIQGRGTFEYSDDSVVSGGIVRACRAAD